MKTTLFTLTVALFATPLWAADPVSGDAIVGDATAGQQKAMVCSACHGMDGNSLANPEWPTIAGQHAKYINKQLHNFRSGAKGEEGAVVRNNVLMAGQAVGLSDQDIADLAAFYTTQTTQRSKGAAPELVAMGEALYRGGDLTRGIAACSGCHGPNGTGNAEAIFPNLAGQHAEYTVLQLQNFRAGHRANDPGRMMRSIAVRLTDEQIQAVASYIQGLRPTEVQATR